MRLRRTWRAFAELAVGRRIPLRDARGKLALIPHIPQSRWSTIRLWFAGIVLAAAAAASTWSRSWAVAAICAGMVVFFYTLGVIDELSGLARSRREDRIRRGWCPWCNGKLTSEVENDRRTCLSCKAEWWDLVGLAPGVSPPAQREHVLAVGIACSLISLFFGFFGVGPVPTDPWPAVFAWESVVLVVWFGAAVFSGRHQAKWWMGLLAGVPPVVVAFVLLSGKGHTIRAEALLVASVAFGAVGGLGIWIGRRFIPRDIRLDSGRECATCGYDLRGCEPGDPCPECHSLLRVR